MSARKLGFIPILAMVVSAAPGDRIAGPIDVRQTVTLRGAAPQLAQPQFDRGPVSPRFPMSHLVLYVRPSAAQQAELNQLLADQQTASSPSFHKWLTPEEFGNRFGLTAGDHSRIVAWLNAAGFTIDESARARNWVMFSGTAAQVEQALHTSIHYFEVNGERHFANTREPSVPAALRDLVSGIEGLHDFHPKPALRHVAPDYNSGASHYLVPADYTTIYDINPLSAAGIDGTGVNIGIVGASTLLLSDIQAFRSKFGLPARDPKQVLAGSSPGLNTGDLEEADLDIEWAGAVAPGATIYYYYSTSLTTAITSAINANLVHILSVSFAGAEMDNPTLALQPVLQQANAQGITLFAATGDYGAANFPDVASFAHFGPAVGWPASYPEVTAVGGTEFNEGSTPGAYWQSSNDGSNFSSATSYIPEIAWAYGGGGPSAIFTKPAWQTGPGVPQDGFRDLPDVSLASSNHDGFAIYYLGAQLNGIGGTSASTPCMAGITALLIQSLANSSGSSAAGLGNINPQLYRMAQSSPDAFHDITSGANAVTCIQGTPGCNAGSFGYAASPGYDMATGLGSLDVNKFVTDWNTATNAVNVTLSVTPHSASLNDTLQLTATVAPAGGGGMPGGAIDFGAGSTPLGSAALGNGTATLAVPAYLLGGTGNFTITAQYRGDAAFSGGGASATVQLSAAVGAASIVPSAPVSVNAIVDPSGLFWEFTISLRERSGVAAIVTGVKVDGQDQPVAQYFPSPSIPPNGTLVSRSIVYRNLAYPVTRTFVISGVDAAGQTWSRQVSTRFLGMSTGVQAVILSAEPLIMTQDTTAPPDCQWSQRLVLTDISGWGQTVTGLILGNVSLTDQIRAMFGTPLLAPYGSIEGTLCWAAASPGSTDTVSLLFATGFTQDIAVSFAGPPVNPPQIRVSPTSIQMSASGGQPATATVVISAPDGQPWTIGVSPQNLVSSWLSLSQTSGSGSAQITVRAATSSLEAGAYYAELVIQGPNLQPAVSTVPIMLIVGGSSSIQITGVTNAASGQNVAAPGMLALLDGSGLATKQVRYSTGTFYGVGALGGVLVTVNGIPAPVHSVSPTEIAFQIPYEIGTGPAVVGVSHDGIAAGYMIQVAPAAPAIYADANGNAALNATVQAGKTATFTMTGDGVTNPILPDGYYPSTSSLTYKTALPFTLTIGGSPAFLTSYGIAQNVQGVTTLNVTIPVSAPTGVQPVVVTVNGVASPTVNITITPPASQ
jgi:uncharacterized protein (TIGR03437 family)